MGKPITVCLTALLLIGIASIFNAYTVLNMRGGDTTVGDNKTGIVGDNNKGNTMNKYVRNAWIRHGMYLKMYIDMKRMLPYMSSDNYESTLDDIEEYRCYALEEKRIAKLYERLSQYKCPVCGSDFVIDYESDNDYYSFVHWYYCRCEKCKFNDNFDINGETEEEAVEAIIKYLENIEK